jgi:hypothetical protein
VTATEEVAACAHVDWLPHVHFVLDYPAREVWPYLVHWEEWVGDFECEHVSGPVDAAGEKKRVTFWHGEPSSATRHFFAELVRLEPERRLVYRVLPLQDEEQLPGIGCARGYEIFKLYGLSENQTLVAHESVAELGSSTIGQREFTRMYREQEAALPPRWLDNYVPELKRMLQEGR